MIKCVQCGLCCRSAGLIPDFPEPLNEDGSCTHLKDNKCSIYDARPMICRSKEMYETYFSDMPQNDFIEMNRQACIAMMQVADYPVPKDF